RWLRQRPIFRSIGSKFVNGGNHWRAMARRDGDVGSFQCDAAMIGKGQKRLFDQPCQRAGTPAGAREQILRAGERLDARKQALEKRIGAFLLLLTLPRQCLDKSKMVFRPMPKLGGKIAFALD